MARGRSRRIPDADSLSQFEIAAVLKENRYDSAKLSIAITRLLSRTDNLPEDDRFEAVSNIWRLGAGSVTKEQLSQVEKFSRRQRLDKRLTNKMVEVYSNTSDSILKEIREKGIAGTNTQELKIYADVYEIDGRMRRLNPHSTLYAEEWDCVARCVSAAVMTETSPSTVDSGY